MDKKNNGNCLYCQTWSMCKMRELVGEASSLLALSDNGIENPCERRTIEGNLFRETAQNCFRYKEAEHKHSRIMTVIERQDIKDGHLQ